MFNQHANCNANEGGRASHITSMETGTEVIATFYDGQGFDYDAFLKLPNQGAWPGLADARSGCSTGWGTTIMLPVCPGRHKYRGEYSLPQQQFNEPRH